MPAQSEGFDHCHLGLPALKLGLELTAASVQQATAPEPAAEEQPPVLDKPDTPVAAQLTPEQYVQLCCDALDH